MNNHFNPIKAKRKETPQAAPETPQAPFIKDLIHEYIKGMYSGKKKTKQKTNFNDKTIQKYYNFKNKNKGWENLFFEEKDYHEFRDILIKFFSEPNFEIPTTTIKTKPKTIGKISILLKGIHEHFSEMTGHLIKDERYHHVVRILHEWKDKNSSQIYKAIYKG